jgi:squalene synthase HpnC
MRPHVAAVYAFARTADDFADEGARSDADRLQLLEGWRHRLRESAAGSGTARLPRPGEPADTMALFAALGRTIREKSLPAQPFEDLLSAFTQDVTVHRYSTWEHLLDYCRRSANPVGRLVLRIAGYREDRFDRWSDAICTALQLTNFWQDLKVDFDRGRLYIPLDDLCRYDVALDDLAGGRVTPEWKDLLTELAARTRALFHEGRPLCDGVRGRLRYELRATWLGGMRILDRLEAGGFDVIRRRPVLGASDLPWILGRMATWSLARP